MRNLKLLYARTGHLKLVSKSYNHNWTQPQVLSRIRVLYPPPDHDLSLGYSYKINAGMDSDEAEVLYRELQEKINQKVSTFPDNYSLSDGLLYLGHPQEELTTS